MKNLVFIGGTMGVGKTATSRALQWLLPNCVFLDGDWCWDAKPFCVSDETKSMVMGNIKYLLNAFLRCSTYENVVFCWVMHMQGIIDEILSGLEGEYTLYNVSLVCSREKLEERLRADIARGLRDEDVIERSIPRLPLYDVLNTRKVCTDDMSAEQCAEYLSEVILNGRK